MNIIDQICNSLREHYIVVSCFMLYLLIASYKDIVDSINHLRGQISGHSKGARSLLASKVMESTYHDEQHPQDLTATGYLWIPKRELHGQDTRPYFDQINPVPRWMTDSRVFYPWFSKPRIMWSLVDHTDPDRPPEIKNDNVFTSGNNCFREFEVHDYNCSHNLLWFRSRFTDGGHWVMLEF